MRRVATIEREMTFLSLQLGTGASGNKIDTTTPRLPILNKIGDGPIIAPSGVSWMSGAVFDGRPIVFHDRKLIYFCGQPMYRADGAMFVGLAEWTNGELVVDPVPVLWPDIEHRGIDIPAFTVWRDLVVAVYLDDYGPDRTGKGYDTSLIVAQSSDGRIFKKNRLKTPFGRDWTRIGLPWILADDECLWIYWRGRKGNKSYLVRTELSTNLDGFVGQTFATPIPRNAINVAVTKRTDTYVLFYGGSRAGGLYVSNSSDGISWNFDDEVMLVGNKGHEWGWDFYKVCGSPDNTTNSLVNLCYLAVNKDGFGVGMADFDTQDLKRQ